MIGMSPIASLNAMPTWASGAGVASLPMADRTGSWRPSLGMLIDLDDTLYPLGRFRQSGFGAVAAHVEATCGVPAESAYALLSRRLARGEHETAFQSLCRKFSLASETVPVLIEVYRAHRPSLFLGHGARDLLRTLRAESWRVAVLTNGLPQVQARKVEALGLAELVDDVIYAEQLAPGGKPAADVFLGALARLGTRADRTVCVGDDPRCDVGGARSAGLATVRLAVPGVEVPPDLEADIVVASLADVAGAATSLIQGAARHAA